MVYSTDRSKAVVPVLILLFVALWFILRGDFFYVLPCVILFLCFSVLLALLLSRLGKRELILVLFYVCSICACLVLSVFSSSWCLGRPAVYDCGIPWTFLLSFFFFFFFFFFLVGGGGDGLRQISSYFDGVYLPETYFRFRTIT